MIPVIVSHKRRADPAAALCAALLMGAGAQAAEPARQAAAPTATPTTPSTTAAAREKPSPPAGAPTVSPAPVCLSTGDGYLRARLSGTIEATIDWPNSGTRCEGGTKVKPPGVRLSFQRTAAGAGDLLFLFGLTGVQPGKPGRAVATNLTLIVQGTGRMFGTLGDSRCTVDSLAQRPLPAPGSYRLEAHGFCTQPAHAVRGDGAVLVSTFDFAGLVSYAADELAPSVPASAALRP